jgi:uncharacterized membrane protein YphA (DoxX/SURF4 family)
MTSNSISRRYLAVLRILLGVIFLVTWADNLGKGFYTPAGFREFILSLADGHPLGFYRAFLEGVVAPVAGIFAPFQMVAELGMGLALLTGAFTPLAGLGAAFFFLNLLLAYLNPALGEWIWTYVLLVTVAVVVTLSSAGRAWGIDSWLLNRRGSPRLPLY